MNRERESEIDKENNRELFSLESFVYGNNPFIEFIQQDVDIKETINKEVKTEERWAKWSWIVTGPNGWEDFESLTRPVTCTLNGSPLPLGDSKHSSCLLLFYISHSYVLHSKLGLSCTDRLV